MRVLFLGVLFLVAASFCVIGAAQYRPPGIEVVEPPIDIVVPSVNVVRTSIDADEPSAGLEQPPQPKDAPDEFDIALLNHRIEATHKLVFNLWDAITHAQVNDATSPDEIARLKEKADRLTLEAKDLRRQRDEMSSRMKEAGIVGDSHPAPTRFRGTVGGFSAAPRATEPARADDSELDRAREENERLRAAFEGLWGRKVLRRSESDGSPPTLSRLRSENDNLRARIVESLSAETLPALDRSGAPEN